MRADCFFPVCVVTTADSSWQAKCFQTCKLLHMFMCLYKLQICYDMWCPGTHFYCKLYLHLLSAAFSVVLQLFCSDSTV